MKYHLKNRLQYLDSARGFAAIAVLIFHAVLSFGEIHSDLNSISECFKAYFDLGKIGVIVFFVISGFVIPFSFKGRGVNALKSFAISRFFRLYPVYWLSAILGFILYQNYSWADLAANFTMLQQFIGFPNIIGLYWTLQIELIFYFLIAITFIINRLNQNKFLFYTSIFFLLIATMMAYVRGLYAIKLPLAVPLALSLMYFGSYFRHAVINHVIEAKFLSKIYIIVYALLIPLISWWGYQIDFGFDESWYKYVITYYSGLALFLLIIKLKFSNSISSYLGAISYSVYLFHPLVILILSHQLFGFISNGYLKVVFTLLLTVTFSSLTYRFIEKTAIKIGHRIRNLTVKQD